MYSPVLQAAREYQERPRRCGRQGCGVPPAPDCVLTLRVCDGARAPGGGNQDPDVNGAVTGLAQAQAQPD